MSIQPKLSFEEFERLVVVERFLYTNGKLVYKASFLQFSDELEFSLEEADDIDHYDELARYQLVRNLITVVNKTNGKPQT